VYVGKSFILTYEANVQYVALCVCASTDGSCWGGGKFGFWSNSGKILS